MRVMVIVKASKDSEAGVMPSQQELADMGNFNEELVKAGVMLAGEGLQASAKGKRVRFGDKPTVIDGPFTETKELIAGFWLWQVRSIDEAVEWLKKAPFGRGEEVEIRRVFETEDFGAEMTPELRRKTGCAPRPRRTPSASEPKRLRVSHASGRFEPMSVPAATARTERETAGEAHG